MNKSTKSLFYLQEESLRNLIRFLAQNHFNLTPRVKFVEQVSKAIQKIVNNEGKKNNQADFLKAYRRDLETLLHSAWKHQNEQKIQNLGKPTD